MFIYFALPMAFNDLRIDPFTAAVVTIMINPAVTLRKSRVVRCCLFTKSFVKQDWRSVFHVETIRYVILPLALRRMLPPLGNQWIISAKDTSLFIVIGVAELTRQGEIMPVTSAPLRSGAPWRVFYLIITLVLSFILRRLERRMKIL